MATFKLRHPKASSCYFHRLVYFFINFMGYYEDTMPDGDDKGQ